MSLRTVVPIVIALAYAPGPGARAQDAAAIFDKVHHALFMVIVTTDAPGVVDVVSQGSAVLIAPNRLVTNCHIVDRGAAIFVSRSGDKLSRRARVAGRHGPTDFCELDVLEGGPAFSDPVRNAPPGGLRVGDPVYAIGFHGGHELAVSEGAVSAFLETKGDIRIIRTTLPFSADMSGGGLFDRRGDLVGIMTTIVQDPPDLGFAVLSRYVRSAGHTEPRRPERPVAANPAPAATPPRNRPPKEMAALLVVDKNAKDTRPGRTYEQLRRDGALTGLDDDEIVRKVYGAVIHDLIGRELRWRGGSETVLLDLQLRRNGEVMFVLPVRSSGNPAFDREAERALGVASPFPVPQDDAAFEAVRTLRLAVGKK